MASVGDDEVLRLWNTQNRIQVAAKNIGARATCIDLSPDQRYIVIGLENGAI